MTARKAFTGKRKRGHVARREKDKMPKMTENPKKALLLRGTRAGAHGLELLKNIKKLIGPERGVTLSRKNLDMRPFDNSSSIEFCCQKNDCGLFVLTNHSKKRPDNVLLGRIFDDQILDMVELHLVDFKSLESKLSETRVNAKALGGQSAVIFQGEGWESSSRMKTLRSLFIDLFKQESHSEIDISAFDHVCVCTSTQEKVYIRNYLVAFRGNENHKVSAKQLDGTSIPDLQLIDIGPSMDFSIRRVQEPSAAHMKLALKQPKLADKAKKIKNVTHDSLQGKLGRVHMQKQQLDDLVTRSRFGRALKSDTEGSR